MSNCQSSPLKILNFANFTGSYPLNTLANKTETENLLHVFWKCEKTKAFWYSVLSWLQACQVTDVLLQEGTALSLRPDKTKNKLQINFCLLSAKYYIWLCQLRERKPKLNDFLHCFKHIYQIENNKYVNDYIENTQTTIPKKWEPFLPYL